jgi:hypothetical protein
MRRCQQPRKATRATPAKLVAMTPGHHQPDFLSLTGFSRSTGSVIGRSVIRLSIWSFHLRSCFGRFFLALLHDRPNRREVQSLKGRSSAFLTPAGTGFVSPVPQSDVYHRTLRYPPKDYYAGIWSCSRRLCSEESELNPILASQKARLGWDTQPFGPWIPLRDDEILIFFVPTARA